MKVLMASLVFFTATSFKNVIIKRSKIPSFREIPEELMQSVGFVEPGLSVSREVEDVAVSVVDAAPLLLDVFHVELLAADQRIGLENKSKMS
jgi:hypothetical protein